MATEQSASNPGDAAQTPTGPVPLPTVEAERLQPIYANFVKVTPAKRADPRAASLGPDDEAVMLKEPNGFPYGRSADAEAFRDILFDDARFRRHPPEDDVGLESLRDSSGHKRKVESFLHGLPRIRPVNSGGSSIIGDRL